MRNILARIPPAAVVAICVLWIIAAFALPLLVAHFKGWGVYWAFSVVEFFVSLALLVGPPLLLVLIWRRNRGERPGEGAV